MYFGILNSQSYSLRYVTKNFYCLILYIISYGFLKKISKFAINLDSDLSQAILKKFTQKIFGG